MAWSSQVFLAGGCEGEAGTITPLTPAPMGYGAQVKPGLRSRSMPRSFRIEMTRSAATEPGEDLKTNLEARAPGFGAEDVNAELSGDEWSIAATFLVDTREEAEGRMEALLAACGFPPSATSAGAAEISDVTEETSP